jgi:carnitine-CoA ligase
VTPALYHETTAAIGVRFSVRRFWDEVRRFEVTVFDFMGSTLALLWKKEPRPDDRDNPALLGWGVPLPDFSPAFQERFGCTLIDCYGSTDVGLPVCGVPGEPKPAGACGRAAEGCEPRFCRRRDTVSRPGSRARSLCGPTSRTRSWRDTSGTPRRRSGRGEGSGTIPATAAAWTSGAISTSRAG